MTIYWNNKGDVVASLRNIASILEDEGVRVGSYEVDIKDQPSKPVTNVNPYTHTKIEISIDMLHKE